MDPNISRDRSPLQIERLVFDLRRGLPVVLTQSAGPVLVLPTEYWAPEAVPDWIDQPGHSISLILTSHRMQRIDAPGLKTIDAVRLALPADSRLDLEQLRQAACSREMSEVEASGVMMPAEPADRAAIALMRRAQLLPSAVTVRLNAEAGAQLQASLENGQMIEADAGAVIEYATHAGRRVRRVAEAQVPLADTIKSRFVLFREADGLREHIAVVVGEQAGPKPAVPVRIHSACLTGDLFASLRCDCGEQLRTSVARIAELGGGVLLYLAQEGRNIGLANKLRAYGLQDAGRDTVEADAQIGFGADERDYQVAIEMLEQLDINSICLLTNNPSKIAAMREGGIDVVGREAIYGRVTVENRRYLNAKASRSGHLLRDVLDE
ncbi:MAG: GTP cyclohydrolase II RibA [Wenzhouxiangellaceae bacterium]|nr:GTP cyclohydrolase II RibA [Wenzhouxiangellaceae bacterium]